MSSSTCTFPNERDQQLHARLEVPDSADVRATAVFAHCFTCSKDLKAVRRIARGLTRAGIAVLSFDFAGIGQSEGDFADSTFAADVDDLVAAAGYLRETLEAPSLLIGHSLGGAASIMAAARIEEVVAVATIGAPADPSHVQDLFDDDLEAIRRDGTAAVRIAGREFTVSAQLVEDLAAHRPTEVLADLDAAVLIFHSPADEVVGIDNAQTLYQAAHHPKSFVSLDRADHLLSDGRDADHVARMTASLVARYLPEPADEGTADQADPGGDGTGDGGGYGDTTVTARNTGGYATPITARGLSLLVDEPAEMGGTETGLTPYDHLGVALASCTALTLRIVAEREDIPLDAVEVAVSHDQVHAKDCTECGDREGRVDRLRRTVTVSGDLTDAQRQRLHDVADRCPVHKTLTAGLVVVDDQPDRAG